MEHKEIFRDIEGYEGLYKVSNYGRVYSYHKDGLKGSHYDRYGYEIVRLYSKYDGRNGKGRLMKVHRLVAMAFLNNYDNKPEVNHKDENKANNHLWNLEWCTREYNIAYSLKSRRERRELKLNKQNNAA